MKITLSDENICLVPFAIIQLACLIPQFYSQIVIIVWIFHCRSALFIETIDQWIMDIRYSINVRFIFIRFFEPKLINQYKATTRPIIIRMVFWYIVSRMLDIFNSFQWSQFWPVQTNGQFGQLAFWSLINTGILMLNRTIYRHFAIYNLEKDKWVSMFIGSSGSVCDAVAFENT